ncbi:F-box protein At3g58530-like isoform X1 [Papaver somniferum]|uniref:F-box protein At3g58530-like isoform X1 n=1 Tax=Papaver somniferum TaxID=3469 RepID=UPI000E6F74EA|nr:F-box protein At3g58530-like isoform X1 [Papaver somniferum]XP_026414871.1 F-box protein At3g58530-like isoform X1 [Papaver somniferum]
MSGILIRETEEIWRRETVPRVLQIVSTTINLTQRDLISLLLVSPWLYRTLVSYPSLWQVIDLREMSNAGERLISALSLSRYLHIKRLNLEFAQDVEDKHLNLLKSKCKEALGNLESLNLNGCQKISDKGIEVVTSACPKLKAFSIYWNIRVTDLSIQQLVKNCSCIIDMNLSGCKNITDKSMHLIADHYNELEELNLTRCVKLTDGGLQQILLKCSSLQYLNLYALSGFTDGAYMKISHLAHLRVLDLCGAQNLSNQGLSSIARCKNLVSLNLTWCVLVTDAGVVAIARGCPSLEFLSLFGILGVTDMCLEVLSGFCSKTLTTLDVNGCTGIKKRSRDELIQLFPKLTCFKVHS